MWNKILCPYFFEMKYLRSRNYDDISNSNRFVKN